MTNELISGWGRTQWVRSQIQKVSTPDEVREVIQGSGKSIIPRGLGRSYGDAAQLSGGVAISIAEPKDDPVITDGKTTLSAGYSLDNLLKRIVPKGYFVPVTPGTRYVTLGGALASDIHGKNHHLEGTFSRHIESFVIVTPTGTHLVTENSDPDLFNATAGGMGLTGVVTDMTMRLIPIESAYIKMETSRLRDLDETLATMAGSDHKFRYSVAWIDLMARGSSMGRSVLTRGDHAQLSDLPSQMAQDPYRYDAKAIVDAPNFIPNGLLNNLTVRAFNELWFRKAPSYRADEIATIASFFHPLDMVGKWNRIYGKRGFLQYQFVLPDGQEETLREIIDRLSTLQVASFLAVLKRFGEENEGFLSFPRPGWTLALDIPITNPELGSLLDELDQIVLKAGGRIYLAKDSRMSKEIFEEMYPKLDKFKEVKSRVDPNNVITSDIATRLSIS
ncbi:MAG: FAD-binding oxidoreductase [Actinomycetota bacterium]|nr:FAD-binding oxidoreductase [Actinomycetota bacterium]